MDNVIIDGVARVCSVHDLPCKHCGKTIGEHTPYRDRGDHKLVCESTTTQFEHADTPPCEPDCCPQSKSVGHLYCGPGGHIYRSARLVTFPHLSGDFDVEIEPVVVAPAAPEWCRATRRLISARALGRTFHHDRSCPCWNT